MNISEMESRTILEAARWPNGPICPKCNAERQSSNLKTRPGLYTCRSCRGCQYSVTSGTPLHGTRVDLGYWIRLIHSLSILGRNPTPAQVARSLDVSYLTARSMIERVAALKDTRPVMHERIVEGIRKSQQREAA